MMLQQSYTVPGLLITEFTMAPQLTQLASVSTAQFVTLRIGQHEAICCSTNCRIRFVAMVLSSAKHKLTANI
jgi:hypothetical protein